MLEISGKGVIRIDLLSVDKNYVDNVGEGAYTYSCKFITYVCVLCNLYGWPHLVIAKGYARRTPCTISQLRYLFTYSI
jgi:hypothetical protein